MNAFESNFVRLQCLEWLQGICAARGAQIVSNHLPISDKQTVELLEVIEEMMAGYEGVERDVGRLVFGYDRGILLIACRGERRMVALANENADIERIMRGMEGFLESHLKFQVKRPKRMKRPREDPERPPLSTKDEWGRRTISLQGLRAVVDESSGNRGRMLPLPPLPGKGKKAKGKKKR